MADDGLDELYAAAPDQFTALRTRLAAEARKARDTDAAKRISAARKPTRAAWVVNLLAIRDQHSRERLSELGERLRAAHQEMNGERIRELTGAQRRLVDALAREAFGLAGIEDPTAVLHDGVVGTLQAAIADPEVLAALGRLTKAQQWSGFGAPGDLPAAQAGPAASGPSKDVAAQREEAQAGLAAAERAHSGAEDHREEQARRVEQARGERDTARRRLEAAEADLREAQQALSEAARAAEVAAADVERARAHLDGLY